jgi:hypothetical protein
MESCYLNRAELHSNQGHVSALPVEDHFSAPHEPMKNLSCSIGVQPDAQRLILFGFPGLLEYFLETGRIHVSHIFHSLCPLTCPHTSSSALHKCLPDFSYSVRSFEPSINNANKASCA